MRSVVTRHTKMASSSPPPLIPINGSNNVCYRETNNSAASKPINRLELQFGEFFNGASHECFKTTNASSNGEYHQQQSNYLYKYPNQFTTHSQMEINKSEFFQSTRPNPPPPENQLFPVADIPADLLFQHADLQKVQIDIYHSRYYVITSRFHFNLLIRNSRRKPGAIKKLFPMLIVTGTEKILKM